MSLIRSWGANSHGQLGQNIVSEQCISPQNVEPSLWGVITTMAAGGGHSFVLDDHGKLFGCGWNNHIQLGSDDEEANVFKRVWNLSGILFKAISCGWDGTCAVSSDDRLYVWGSNCYGQLGLPRDHYPKNVRPIKLELQVAIVAMGMRHSAVVDSNGRVWITGLGKMGQLGLGPDIILMDRFTRISGLSNISLMSCGQYHSIAYSDQDNTLYAWGDNRYGQLLDHGQSRVFSPIKVDIEMFGGRIKQLQSGWTHSAALTETGHVYLWGRNNYGQLGCPTVEISCNTLTLQDNPEIKEIAMGSEHGLCLTADGCVWSWGWNEHGNTGVDSLEEVIWEPTKLKFKNDEMPLKIFSGSGHSFAIVKSE